jgi:Xaa-Pro aminopeptidase
MRKFQPVLLIAMIAGLPLVLPAQVKSDNPARYIYDSDRLPASFHAGRREALRALLPDSAVAVFFAAPERNRANDVDFQYHQDPNFYYLTGFEEPNSVLLVFKEKRHIDTMYTNEILFVPGRNPAEEVWTGHRFGKNGAKTILGINSVQLNSDFRETKLPLENCSKVFFFKLPDDVHNDTHDKSDLSDLVRNFETRTQKLKNTDTRYLGEYMAMLREIKLPEEMVLLRKAIDMSCAGHIELIKALEPGMNEYEAQAVIEYMFKKYGSEYCGYPSIVGGGENSCILHYISNRKPLTGKDMLVVDAGAEYHGYTADITRTLPTDGQFSEPEKAIYNIVLEAQEAGIKACREGNEFRQPHKEAVKVIQKRLKELGIIEKEEDYQRYFFHGTSHYLGLDVHDAGMYGHLKAGNVITVEPGIYIPEGSPCDPKWWNIGIRIEDDILITATDPEVLSKAIPKTVAEIEALMKEKSFLNQGDTSGH